MRVMPPLQLSLCLFIALLAPAVCLGLGTYNSKNIGAYGLGISRAEGANTNGNGESLNPILSSDGGETWFRSGTDFMGISSDNDEIYGFTKDL
jgi:hypothetical protein